MACNDNCDCTCLHRKNRVHCADSSHPYWPEPNTYLFLEDDCEHPADMVGPWSTHGGSCTCGPDYYIVGWTCAACGFSMTTGTSKGRPRFNSLPIAFEYTHSRNCSA